MSCSELARYLRTGRARRHPHLVERAMRQAVTALPAELARTITWDQGTEMARHADFTIAAGIPVYFCDPTPPGRGIQREHQRAAAPVPAQGHRPVRALRRRPRQIVASLSNRPRKTPGFMKPSERLAELLAHTA